MAGDWIAMRVTLSEEREVVAIAQRLDIPETQVVGCLHRVWSWFDQHSTDGNAAGVTLSFLDRYVAVSGFANAMRTVGWLKASRTQLTIPNFERYNGETAKRRALGRRRVTRHRALKRNGGVTDAALPTEQNRTEQVGRQEPAASCLPAGAEKVIEELTLAGIGEPKRTELARTGLLTPQLVRDKRAVNSERGKGGGALVRDLEQAVEGRRITERRKAARRRA